ncbi:MAG TPA: hypothetical protein VM101_14915 [Flavitalea sp.]|nr:hypothetical protein [Flavitalea sp.]
MNRLINNRLPNIFRIRLHLNELKSQMDEEVMRRTSFDHQRNLYMEIQQLECVIKGWQWQADKQLESQLHY